MPKIKTHSSSKKRFRLTASGKVRFNSAMRRHRLISKTKQAKERNQGTKIMSESDARVIRRHMLPNG
ncbi:MAG: 50S ribosomal protein L35 [Rhodospirillaceae bacterium]|nr:50S ribosomal protein L35 [Rhodospirillaceae bacterium]